MELLFVPLALLAGVLLTVQVGANTQLARALADRSRRRRCNSGWGL